MNRLAPIAWVSGIALALWLALGSAFANYDTFYSLVWGNEIAHGQSPDYGGQLVPTPHPLSTAFGILASPLGDGAETAVVIAGFLALGAIGYLVYRLGEAWLNPWVGVLAAVIVLTRVPFLDYGARAYVDLPYIAFVLGAVVVEARRPRAGWPVLVLLGVAGLMRPEAWLFAGAYLLYLWWAEKRFPDWRLIGLAAAAPLLWAAFDWIVSGDPLYSLTGTQDTVSTLERDTGIADAVRLAPRRLGEILREPVLLAAAGGLFFGLLAALRRKTALPAASAGLALAAFGLLAAAGLAVITRYLLLTGVFLAVLAAGGILGWLSLDRDDPWRRWWMGFAAVATLALLVFVPQQAGRIGDLRDSLAAQEQVRDDLHDVIEEPTFDQDCRPVAIPSTQGVPNLALWLGIRPSDIVTDEVNPTDGYLISPASPTVADTFLLDENDPAAKSLPTGGVNVRIATSSANRSWLVFGYCGERSP